MAVPITGWPAKGISMVGVKMRTRAVWAVSSGGIDEGDLGEVELGRDGLQVGLGQGGGVGEDGQLVAAEAGVGEDVVDDIVRTCAASSDQVGLDRPTRLASLLTVRPCMMIEKITTT